MPLRSVTGGTRGRCDACVQDWTCDTGIAADTHKVRGVDDDDDDDDLFKTELSARPRGGNRQNNKTVEKKNVWLLL